MPPPFVATHWLMSSPTSRMNIVTAYIGNKTILQHGIGLLEEETQRLVTDRSQFEYFTPKYGSIVEVYNLSLDFCPRLPRPRPPLPLPDRPRPRPIISPS